MLGRWKRTVEPTAEPVTLAEVKAQCHVETSDEDTKLNDFIAAARERCETVTGRALITQTWELTLDEWPRDLSANGEDRYAIVLPRPPAQSVTSVKHFDTDGVEQTLTAVTDYRVDVRDPETRITPAWGTSWPSIRHITGAITVTSVHGYGDASTDVPQGLRQGMLMLIEQFYRHRGDDVTGLSTAKLSIRSHDIFMSHAVAMVA